MKWGGGEDCAISSGPCHPLTQGLWQASPTWTQHMHMLADAAGTVHTAMQERPAKTREAEGTRVACGSRSTNMIEQGRHGQPRASLDRPWPRRDTRTPTLCRHRRSPVDAADRRRQLRAIKLPQPDSRRARLDKRRSQACQPRPACSHDSHSTRACLVGIPRSQG